MNTLEEEIKKALEALKIERDYSEYYGQNDKRNVIRKQKKRPLIIEFSGIPKSGKTTCIEAAKKIFSSYGFNVKVVEEKASQCSLNKFDVMFNFWTFTNFVNDLNEILQINEKFSDYKKYDLILCDRGAYDALVWFKWQLDKNSINEEEYKVLKSIILWDKIIHNIHYVIVLDSPYRSALHREPADSIISDLNHSIMKDKVLKSLNKAIIEVENIYKNLNTNVSKISSIFGKENQLKSNVILKIVECMKEHYNENIAFVEKNLLNGLDDSAGIQSASLRKEVLDSTLKFLPRNVVEKDEKYIQIIPICIVISKDKQKLLCVKKNPNAVERENNKAPELNKDLFYIGGHIRNEDKCDTTLKTMIKALKREIFEEIGLSIVIDENSEPKFVYVPDSPKSAKHLAAYWIISVEPEIAEIKPDGNELLLRKGKTNSGKFFKMSDMTSDFSLEGWSKTILQHEFSSKLSNEFKSACIDLLTPLEMNTSKDNNN